MRRLMVYIYAIAVLMWVVDLSLAAEHGGNEHGGIKATHEHGGEEHGGMKMSAPSSTDIQKTMKAYVDKQVEQSGSLEVYDDKINKTRKLSLLRIHERVGKTGNYYYSCADFKDTESDETVDVDIDVENKNGELQVVDVRIHKVNGKERYTYDANDNRIPVEQ